MSPVCSLPVLCPRVCPELRLFQGSTSRPVFQHSKLPQRLIVPSAQTGSGGEEQIYLRKRGGGVSQTQVEGIKAIRGAGGFWFGIWEQIRDGLQPDPRRDGGGLETLETCVCPSSRSFRKRCWFGFCSLVRLLSGFIRQTREQPNEATQGADVSSPTHLRLVWMH